MSRLRIGVVATALAEILAWWWTTADNYTKPGGLL